MKKERDKLRMDLNIDKQKTTEPAPPFKPKSPPKKNIQKPKTDPIIKSSPKDRVPPLKEKTKHHKEKTS